MEQDPQPEKTNVPLFKRGSQNPERFGSIDLKAIGSRTADFSEAVEKIAKVLGRPAQYIDDEGYDHEIIAGAIQDGTGSIAWIECRSKQLEKYVDVEFRLKAKSDGKVLIDWEVETYNPYFGCRVRYMAWHDQRVVVIYDEKHYTYACSLPLSGQMSRVKIDDDWMMTTNQIAFANENLDRIEQLSVPELTKLDSIDVKAARSQGVLPHRFDARLAARQAWRTQFAKRSWGERIRFKIATLRKQWSGRG